MHKGLVSCIYEELLHISKKKTSNSVEKFLANANGYFTEKETCIVNNQRDVQLHNNWTDENQG